MNSESIKVRPGEPVEDGWKRLLVWVESLKIIRHPSYRVKELAGGGVQISTTQVTQFSHPFYASAGFLAIRVSTGLVNGVIPTMKDLTTRKMKRLDNRDDKGITIKGESSPTMKIDLTQCSEDGRIFICIRVAVANKDEAGVSAALTSKDITVVTSPTPDGEINGAKDGAGYHPIAMLYLSQDRKSIGQLFQITHHNLLHSVQTRKSNAAELSKSPNKKTVGRHIFRPA